MDDRANHLLEEAQHADSAYRQFEKDLAINPNMFRLYSSPKQRGAPREEAAILLGDVKNKRLFDMGSGMGEEAVYFAKLGASVTAIDVSSVGVALTLRRAKYNGVEVDARAGDVLDNELPAHSFDLVHGIGILHHVGLNAGLRETARLLKPGGRGVFMEHMSSPFVEKLKRIVLNPNDPHYTADETALCWPDCVREVGSFRSHTLIPFALLSRLKNRFPIFDNSSLYKCEHLVLRAFPWSRGLAGGVIICVEV